MTVPKIKVIFIMAPSKQRSVIYQLSIDAEDVAETTEEIAENERSIEALSFLDVDLEINYT